MFYVKAKEGIVKELRKLPRGSRELEEVKKMLFEKYRFSGKEFDEHREFYDYFPYANSKLFVGRDSKYVSFFISEYMVLSYPEVVHRLHFVKGARRVNNRFTRTVSRRPIYVFTGEGVIFDRRSPWTGIWPRRHNVVFFGEDREVAEVYEYDSDYVDDGLRYVVIPLETYKTFISRENIAEHLEKVAWGKVRELLSRAQDGVKATLLLAPDGHVFAYGVVPRAGNSFLVIIGKDGDVFMISDAILKGPMMDFYRFTDSPTLLRNMAPLVLYQIYRTDFLDIALAYAL